EHTATLAAEFKELTVQLRQVRAEIAEMGTAFAAASANQHQKAATRESKVAAINTAIDAQTELERKNKAVDDAIEENLRSLHEQRTTLAEEIPADLQPAYDKFQQAEVTEKTRILSILNAKTQATRISAITQKLESLRTAGLEKARQSQLANIDRQIAEAKTQLENPTTEYMDDTARIGELVIEIERLSAAIQELDLQLQTLDNQVTKTTEALTAKQAEERQLAERMRLIKPELELARTALFGAANRARAALRGAKDLV
ncbi:MAG: hypothetical protein QME05_03435, partial [Candidatus Margulisbacteria bacterium]|nr:hypothetical protein [Candidatus Margulisiibacteriota bacterium]